jgi:hypothetical protein
MIPRWDKELKAEFIRQWNAGTPTEDMMAQFRFKHGASVSKRASRLDLPRRINARVPWTIEEDDLLRRMWGDADALLTVHMVKRLGHGRNEIISRAAYLGLAPRRPLYSNIAYLKRTPWRWTPERNEYLRWMWVECGGSYAEVARNLKTTVDSVSIQRKKLGLPGALMGRITKGESRRCCAPATERTSYER